MIPSRALTVLASSVAMACHGGVEPSPPVSHAVDTAVPDSSMGGSADLPLPVSADAASDASIDSTSDGDAADAAAWPPASPGFVAKRMSDVCFGDCPVYTVTLHADGAFVVAVTSPRKGCISGTAPLDRVGKVEALARSADFLHARPVYETRQHDRRWITTTLTLDGQVHGVRRWGYDAADPGFVKLVAIEDAIEEATSASTLADKGPLAPCGPRTAATGSPAPPPGSLLATMLGHPSGAPYTVEAYLLSNRVLPCTCPPHAICGACGPSYVVLGEEAGLDPAAGGPHVVTVDAPATPAIKALAQGSKHMFTLRTFKPHEGQPGPTRVTLDHAD